MAFVGGALIPDAAQAGEQAGADVYTSSVDFDAWHGDHEIRTGPATVNGVGYIHGMQMDVGAQGGSFIAIGTSRGLGVPGTQCSDQYSGGWDIYTDGEIGGVYFCRIEELNAYNAGDTAAFTLRWGDCPGAAQDRWLFFMGGPLRRCDNASSHTASRVMVMLETTGSSNVDRNLDVTYTNLEWRSTEGVYVKSENMRGDADPSYTVSFPANGKVNAFLAPLD